ncbi:magnesium chelatase [Candidatus Roizmanbacteria bacterium RIFCSPHIGHO2_01_FULL_39_12c]|uniref:Magnesium chelatase n=1 Tax=Candidatus Roizmanbacteria bacterium RIFCSPHIGHO2_01_FULL_39_12c TaxID=1802031 RepID=A0A1F7G8N1_9BACT|nr:MAG: magnesium chelatase [Candidatus Roizmanbacteria bacterium RIFCSPHIGHO2_01_FULL_39_12c]OGK47732.1 MAG: magnesium chelatase [Candidatus Roizmanbacteria bacterium RIFCSPLOWO2_01_FULL_40_13]
MLAKIFSATTVGLDGVLLEVEVDVAGKGFPTFTIVGLPSKSVDEAKDRVRTAIENVNFEMPDSRLTVNLAPADIPKEGSSLDLPIAVGILAACGYLDKDQLKSSFFIGELSLEGNTRKVPGIISVSLLCKKLKLKSLYLPRENAQEAGLVEGIDVYPAGNLGELILHLNGEKAIDPQKKTNWENIVDQENYEFDFADIKGQEQAKRALEIAAAGFHNLLLKGPPGAGKTMLSRAFPSILPKMDKDEIVEVSKIYSVMGLLQDRFFIDKRPFRTPHHTTSRIGLIGGGTHPAPGEISLSHRGVLFLDELPEFPRSVLEALRQPLEDGKVQISRAAGSISFPSRFLLLAASNPCPCGYLGHPKRSCRCMPGSIIKYRKRLSGPLLDRIDLHIDVPPVKEESLYQSSKAESSGKMRERVVKARALQQERFKNLRIKSNGEMNSAQVRNNCRMTKAAEDLLKQAISQLSLSARSYFKVIKVAQTIVDLSSKEKIEAASIAEALQYRAKDE